MDWIMVKSLAQAFDSYFHIPSSVYFLKNIYLPVMFTSNEGGVFYFEGHVYKFVCFKDLDTAYFHIKAYAPKARLFMIGLYNVYTNFVYAKVVPLKLASNNDKQYYCTYRFTELYNPSNKLHIKPCTYGRTLSLLFPRKRKSFQAKTTEGFKPLANVFRLWKIYFGVYYEFNIVLIKKHKIFLLQKYAKQQLLRKVQGNGTESIDGHSNEKKVDCL